MFIYIYRPFTRPSPRSPDPVQKVTISLFSQDDRKIERAGLGLVNEEKNVPFEIFFSTDRRSTSAFHSGLIRVKGNYQCKLFLPNRKWRTNIGMGALHIIFFDCHFLDWVWLMGLGLLKGRYILLIMIMNWVFHIKESLRYSILVTILKKLWVLNISKWVKLIFI